MTEIKTGITQKTLREEYREHLRQTAWVRRLLRNSETLDSLGDIVALDSLWDYAYGPHTSPVRRTLYLRYRGKALNEATFKPDSIRIMKALKCLFGDPEIRGGFSSSPPSTHYIADGRVGKIRVRVDLVVPWLPKGCEVRTERYQERRTNLTYSVSCRR